MMYPNSDDHDEYFAPIPPEIDARAKSGRIHHYQRVRDSSGARLIAKKNPNLDEITRPGWRKPTPGEWLDLKVAVEFTRQFVEAPMGIITDPAPGAPILGTHNVAIMGLSEPRRSFVIANGWGDWWGDNSFGYMPFDFFDRFMVESYAIDERKPVLPKGDDVISFFWDELDPLGGRIHGMELYDPLQDERIGWSFAVLREGFLDVEELYVRRDYRRRGHGSRLVEMIQELARGHGLPIRAWIPYADVGEENRPALAALLERLGLGIRRSGVRWAAYKATQDEPKTVNFPITRVPARPAAMPDEGEGVRHVKTLRQTVLKHEEPFAPAVSADEWEAAR